MSSFEQSHSTNSFFYFTYKKGRVSKYEFIKTDQVEFLAKLHSFINYVSGTISDADRGEVFSFLGNIVALLLGKKPPEYTQEYSIDELLEFLTLDKNGDVLGLLVAYMIAYEEENEGITDAVFEIMSRYGMQDLVSVFIVNYPKHIVNCPFT